MFLVNCTRVLRTFQHSFNLILDLLAYTIGSLYVIFSCNLTPSDNLHQIWTQKKIQMGKITKEFRIRLANCNSWKFANIRCKVQISILLVRWATAFTVHIYCDRRSLLRFSGQELLRKLVSFRNISPFLGVFFLIQNKGIFRISLNFFIDYYCLCIIPGKGEDDLYEVRLISQTTT